MMEGAASIESRRAWSLLSELRKAASAAASEEDKNFWIVIFPDLQGVLPADNNFVLSGISLHVLLCDTDLNRSTALIRGVWEGCSRTKKSFLRDRLFLEENQVHVFRTGKRGAQVSCYCINFSSTADPNNRSINEDRKRYKRDGSNLPSWAKTALKTFREAQATEATQANSDLFVDTTERRERAGPSIVSPVGGVTQPSRGFWGDAAEPGPAGVSPVDGGVAHGNENTCGGSTRIVSPQNAQDDGVYEISDTGEYLDQNASRSSASDAEEYAFESSFDRSPSQSGAAAFAEHTNAGEHVAELSFDSNTSQSGAYAFAKDADARGCILESPVVGGNGDMAPSEHSAQDMSHGGLLNASSHNGGGSSHGGGNSSISHGGGSVGGSSHGGGVGIGTVGVGGGGGGGGLCRDPTALQQQAHLAALSVEDIDIEINELLTRLERLREIRDSVVAGEGASDSTPTKKGGGSSMPSSLRRLLKSLRKPRKAKYDELLSSAMDSAPNSDEGLSLAEDKMCTKLMIRKDPGKYDKKARRPIRMAGIGGQRKDARRTYLRCPPSRPDYPKTSGNSGDDSDDEDVGDDDGDDDNEGDDDGDDDDEGEDDDDAFFGASQDPYAMYSPPSTRSNQPATHNLDDIAE